MFESYLRFNEFSYESKLFFVLFRTPEVTYLLGPIIYVTCRALAPPSLPAMNMNVSSCLVQAFICAGKNEGHCSSNLLKEYLFDEMSPFCNLSSYSKCENLFINDVCMINWHSLTNFACSVCLRQIMSNGGSRGNANIFFPRSLLGNLRNVHHLSNID